MAKRQLPKLNVDGSSPFARSTQLACGANVVLSVYEGHSKDC
jgi:hypothetical protein